MIVMIRDYDQLVTFSLEVINGLHTWHRRFKQIDSVCDVLMFIVSSRAMLVCTCFQCHMRDYNELIQQHVHPSIIEFIHLFIHSFIHLFTHSFIYAFIHSFIYSFIYSFSRSFIHQIYIHQSLHSFIQGPPFIYSSIHQFIIQVQP